jgi:hypothetical protein
MSGEKSNKRKADDFEKIEAQKAREKEVNAEMGRLISICGGLETHENIESAYDYHVMLGNSHEDVIKQDALAAYMSKYGPELERMNLMEMSLYRKIRRTSEFFLGVYLMEPETVAMLGITIDEWIWSEREGKLSEKHREIARQVEATGGSRAEMFRATMAQYKAEMEILGWDEDSLNLLRLSICQGGRNQSGEPSSNDSNFDVDSDSDSDADSDSDYSSSSDCKPSHDDNRLPQNPVN